MQAQRTPLKKARTGLSDASTTCCELSERSASELLPGEVSSAEKFPKEAALETPVEKQCRSGYPELKPTGVEPIVLLIDDGEDTQPGSLESMIAGFPPMYCGQPIEDLFMRDASTEMRTVDASLVELAEMEAVEHVEAQATAAAEPKAAVAADDVLGHEACASLADGTKIIDVETICHMLERGAVVDI